MAHANQLGNGTDKDGYTDPTHQEDELVGGKYNPNQTPHPDDVVNEPDEKTEEDREPSVKTSSASSKSDGNSEKKTSQSRRSPARPTELPSNQV